MVAMRFCARMEVSMSLSAPSQMMFLVSVILAVIAIVLYLLPTLITAITPYAFWILVVGFVVLAAGCLMRRA